MNQMIMNKLQEKYNELIEKYEEDRILWAAALTTGIYNLDSIGEVPIFVCYLPTEQELYLTYPSKKEDNLIDIRLLKDNIHIIFSPYKVINPKYEEILVNKLFSNMNILNSDSALFESIYQIANYSFAVPAKEQELIEKLTQTEIKVLSNIIKDFNNCAEGDIKVSSKEKEYNISTSVFRTLFYKLKEYGVAEVDSRGVKGTHIKFNNLKTLQSLLINL